MDQSTFTALSGVTLNATDTARWTTVHDAAEKLLERQLGYPLDPSDWSNLYTEIGKTQDECICPDVVTDETELDPPDTVTLTTKYRLFDWQPHDRYLAIDPALAINKVKLVNDGITYKTFDDDPSGENEFMVKWENGNPKYAMYLDMANCGYRRWPSCWRSGKPLQVAVDATWAWTTVPTELNLVLADFITNGFQARDTANIQSESRGSHSYTKFDKEPLGVDHPVLSQLAGPNGLARRKRIV